MADSGPSAAIAPARRGHDQATFVVWDLEYTTWEGAQARDWSGPGEHREIVQIGAVRVDADFNELAALEVIVRPRINPRLSDYFIALTGVAQARVEAEGVDLAAAARRVLDFAAPDLTLIANGTDAEIWAANCALYGLADPLAGRGRNVEHDISRALGRRPMSCELPELFGLPPLARHDGLADARAVASALKALNWRA